MNKLKRVFACILMWAMVLNLCSPMVNVVAASTVDSGEISIHSNTSQNEKRIWFVANGATSDPAEFCQMMPVTGEATISVKGSTDNSAYLCYSGSSKVYLLVMDDYTFVDNDQVIVQGKFQTADGSFAIDIVETTFKYTESSTPKWAIKKDVAEVSSGEIGIHSNTVEKRIARKKEMLETTLDDIKGLASLFKRLAQLAPYYTIGNEAKIKEYNHFNNIKSL